MELQFFGANCLKLSTKRSVVVVDDNLDELGLKSIIKEGDVALFTRLSDKRVPGAKLVVNQPGEYETADVEIQGIAARAHNDEEGSTTATIFKIQSDDVNVAIIGHINPDLSSSQLEQLGEVDVMVLPVGGNGYTLDGAEALKLIKEIEPKIVVPTHYNLSKIKYPIPQNELKDSLKEIGIEPSETTQKLKLKSNALPDGDSTKLIILEA